MEIAQKRILMIEDDRFLRRACATWLGQRGYEVMTAADGVEGLAMARRGGVDLVLLDHLMPRMSGLEVLEALRADPATRSLKVLVVSNSSREEDVCQVARLDAAYFVKASLSLETLTERLREVFAAEVAVP
jgi:two-component system, chemotaxis family, sensor histidine kinase and response regulator WspE